MKNVTLSSCCSKDVRSFGNFLTGLLLTTAMVLFGYTTGFGQQAAIGSISGAQSGEYTPDASMYDIEMLRSTYGEAKNGGLNFDPAENPDLSENLVCSDLRVVLVLDASGSMSGLAEQEARAGAYALAQAFENSYASLKIVEFASEAKYINLDAPLVNSTYLANLHDYLFEETGYNGQHYMSRPGGTPPCAPGYTNWEDALDLIYDQDPLSRPNLVMFVTDGNPTAYNGGPDFDDCGFTVSVSANADEAQIIAESLAAAIAKSNELKAGGTHMFGIGVGNGVNVANLQLISGPDNFAGNGSLYTSDYSVGGIEEIQTNLTASINSICGTELSLTKVVDLAQVCNDEQVVTFTLTAENLGNANVDGQSQPVASNVVLTDDFGSAFTNVSIVNAPVAGASLNGQILTFEIGDLAFGETASIQVQATVASIGTHTNTAYLTSNNADDASAQVDVTLSDVLVNDISVSACESYEWYETEYSESGVYEHEYTTNEGCPAKDILTLTINQPDTSEVFEDACGPFTWDVTGVTYGQSGTYTGEIPGEAGECPEVVILHLEIEEGTVQEEVVVTCGNPFYQDEFGFYFQSGVYERTIVVEGGCDITNILYLTLDGVVGGPCNDGDPTTTDDTIDEDCNCAGTPIVYDCPELQANFDEPCDDGDDTTEGDVITEDCECVGTPIVVYDCPELQANFDEPCDDGDDTTEGDVITEDCECVGTPIVVYDCPELEANFGEACDDGDDNTIDDVITENCECKGTYVVPQCITDAGSISLAGGDMSIVICAVDGVPSTIEVEFTTAPAAAAPYVWVATDALGNVINYTANELAVESFDFDNLGLGTHHLQIVSFLPAESNAHALRDQYLSTGEVNLSELEGCFDISEPIVIIGDACEEPEEGCYAVEVLEFVQGPTTSGGAVAADRSDATKALGEPDRSNAAGGFVSLGVGGYITLAFNGIIYDEPGADIRIFETSFAGNNCSGSNNEQADIELSPDGINFYPVGSICLDGEVDMADAGLSQVFAIRIINSAATTSPDGYDVDGVEAIHGCENGPFTSTSSDCVATEVVSYTPGTMKNGMFLPADRADASQALGTPERTDAPVFVSLGYGGSLVLAFDGSILNQPGADIEIVETTYNFQSCEAYPEYADVYVSIDGIEWHFAKTVCHEDRFVDFSDAGEIPFVNFVKLVNNDDLSNSPDGFDVDGVVCVAPVAPSPAPLVPEQAAGELSSFPNPTAGASNVVFKTVDTERTTVEVMDMNGRVITTLFNQVAEGGVTYTVNFDAVDLPNGIYVYRMTTESSTIIEKFMIAK